MKKIIINPTVENMQPSGIRAFFDLVLGMKDVISLGVGEPDFVTPWHIRESAIYSLEEGYTSYTSNKGLVKLRTYIAQDLKRRHGLSYDIDDQMLITVGVSEAVDLAFRTILHPGDEILIPVPSYVSYGPVAELAGGRPRFIPLSSKNGFKLTPGDIERAVTPHTRAILINYPSNPTGASYKKGELLALARVIAKHDLLVLSDEVYDALTYDFEHVPFPTLPKMKERTVYLNGFSKSYAMTGWRVGFACGPKEIIAGMTKIHQYTIMCVPITSQMAACEAVVGPRDPLDAMKREYMRRREFVVGRLNEIGLDCHQPEGAFYAFPSVRKTKMSSSEFAMRLLQEKKVAVVPGTAFGPEGEGYVRMSFATATDKIKDAFERLEAFVKEHRRRKP
jgi:aminotransferase